MLVREYPEVDETALRNARAAASSLPDDEWFVQVDGTSGLAVLPSGQARGGANERPLRLLFWGGEFGQAAGDWLFFVGLWTPRDFRDEFLAWYRIEHLPILLECPAWSGCRFVEQPADGGCQFFAMHQMVERSALESPQRELSRSTPWFKRLARQPWFDGAFSRRLFRRSTS